MNIKTLHIALTLLAVSTACKAQLIDLEWNGSDSVPPSYTNIYDLGYDYRDKECRFEMEYPEYEVATKEEIDAKLIPILSETLAGFTDLLKIKVLQLQFHFSLSCLS